MTGGYIHAVDIDLERFFDTVGHNKLIEILSRTIKDGRVISLIHKYLNAGVVQGERFDEILEGVSQGGPLSPLLGNVLLNELDWELERRGHKFVRYADDWVQRMRLPELSPGRKTTYRWHHRGNYRPFR